MAIDVTKWETARAKRGLTPKSNQPTKDVTEFFPTLNRVAEISKQNPTTYPKKPTLTETAREIVLPKRGFTNEETMSAQPNIKETITGAAKGVGEIAQGGATLLHMLGNKIADLTLPGYNAEQNAELRNRVNEIVSKKLAPKTAGEAKVMRGVDVAGFVAAPVKASKLSSLGKAVSQVDNVDDARKLLRSADITDEMIARNGWDKKAVSVKTQQQFDEFVKEVEEATILKPGAATGVKDIPNAPIRGIPEGATARIEPTIPTIKTADEAIDTTNLTKTKREALDVFPEKQTVQGLADLESRGRGQVSWEQAKQAAQQLGWTEEKIVNFPKGKAFSDTELMATRGVSKNADDTLSAMEARLQALQPGTPEYIKQTQEVALQRMKAFKLKTVVVGASTEAGRALSSLRSNVEAIDMWEKRVAKLFNDPKTPDYLKENILKTVAEFTGTPEQYAKLLRDSKKSSLLDMAIEYATAIKLTGVPTHVVNTVTGATMVAMRPIERAISSAINKGETLITGAKQQRYFNDAVNDVIGQTMGWRQGGREALNAILDEDYAWRTRPLEDFNLSGPAIKGRPGKNEPIDIALNVAGKTVRVPFRLLGAQDLLIREPAKMGEFYTAIGRLAIDAGHTPGSREYADFFASTLNNPSAEMVEQISKAADRVTFQDELSGGFAQLQKLISNEAKAVRFIVPFFKTIINLQKRALEYSPIAPILPSVRTALKTDPGTRADALARMAVGTSVITPLVYEALDDKITLEAPKNPAERDAFFASGKQAYSIKIGDQWVPFSRLSPFSEWFVTAGLLAKAINNEDNEGIAQLTANTFFGLSANLFDKSFASGMADLLDALRGSEAERQNWLNNFVVGSTLPVLSGNIARTVDPTLREVNSLKDAYMARIPGLSDNVPARNDVFGKPISRPGSAIERFVMPVIPTPATENVVRAELESLGVTMGFPGKSVGGFEMTEEQYYDYQQIAGRATYSALFKLVSNPQFQGLPAGKREEAVNKVITEVRTAVRTKVAAEQVIMKEIQDRLENSGLTSEQAKEKSVEVYEQLKQREQSPQ